MSNTSAIAAIAATSTAEHFFSDVSDGQAEFHSFIKFINGLDSESRDTPFYDFESDDRPDELKNVSVWELFEDEWVGNLVGYMQAMHNNIVRNAGKAGLLTDEEVQSVVIF